MLKTNLAIVLLLMSLALSASPQDATPSPSPDKAVVEGSVVNVQNSRGVPWAKVTLSRAGQASGASSVRADGSGHFLFEHVEPGAYRLSANRPGFYSSVRPGAGAPGAVINVAEGQHVKDLFIRLQPTAAVFGQIVDEHSDPLQEVSVKVLARDYRSGRVMLSQVGKATTDDHGQYRIFGLRPGNYYLLADYRPPRQIEVAAPPPGRNAAGGPPNPFTSSPRDQPPAEPATETAFAYTPLFFPDTSDFLHAQLLTTHPGDEVHADFIMFTMPSVSIKGKVINGLTGEAAEGAEVVATWTEYITGEGVTATVDPNNGSFVVRDLAPGVYTLRTTFTEEKETYTDHRIFEVGMHGIENVVLAGMPNSIVTGHLIVEGDAGDTSDARSVPALAVIRFAGPGAPAIARAQPPKMELVTQLHPGDRYSVTALNLPQDYYLRAVRVSGHEVESDNLVVGARRADLELVISSGGGHIDGFVYDLKDQPRPGLVALFPDDRPVTAESVRRTRADSKGHFALSGLTPGSYKLFAFEDADLDELVNEPELLKQYASESLTVSETGRYAVQLRLVAADGH